MVAVVATPTVHLRRLTEVWREHAWTRVQPGFGKAEKPFQSWEVERFVLQRHFRIEVVFIL